MFIVAVLIVGEVVNLSRPKSEANPHDVAICNGIDNLNAINQSDPNAGATVVRTLDEMDSESKEASPEIARAVDAFTALREQLRSPGRATPQDRTAFANALQAIADACNQLDVPRQ